ncbi:MAG: hypothetical protein LBR14_03120 [Clostridiales Family XIII bacterium]|jgi:hypothetical protein|nr:hypothetical protein [Clostridiales Family XIII bacterium]
MEAEKQTLRQKIKAKKNFLLGVCMILFVIAYPLTYLCAGGTSAPLMYVALAETAAGCLLASIL